MNKKIPLILFIVLCLMLGGCTGTAPASDTAEYETFSEDYPAYFEYSYKSGTPAVFAVANDGRVVIALKQDGKSSCDLIEYSLSGESRKICEYQGMPENMTFMGNYLYILRIKWNTKGSSDGIQIFRFNTETSENELFADLDMPLSFGYGMSGNDNELYIIGESTEQPDAGQNNTSTGLVSIFRVCDGTYEKLPIDSATAVCAQKTGGAIIAAREGFSSYIVQYKDCEFYNKQYVENLTGSITALADIDGEHVVFIASTNSFDSTLCASDINSMYMAELLAGVRVAANGIFTAGGYCFFTPGVDITEDTGDHAVVRIKFADYYKYNNPINYICSPDSGNTPFGCGYILNEMHPSNEEAALKIMSMDKDYDICYLSTGDDISYQIKKKGSFYPLNDIEGVREYLDKCFPSIKEAFTDKNGDIWALPVHAKTQFVFSNNGETDYSKMTMTEFIDYIDGLSDEELEKVHIFNNDLIDDALAEYIITHGSFDTPEFRSFAEKLNSSERLNSAKNIGLFAKGVNIDNLFSLRQSDMLVVLGNNEGRVFGIPRIGSNASLMQDVTFMSINPNSEHLQDAINYITEVVKYQSENEDTFIFREDAGKYSGSPVIKPLLKLCSDTDLYFAYPSELYWEDFNKYLAGEISLDEFITEADRKLKVYLNE
ncbi:MAG: hypothetical protein ACI4WS_01445 [Oscillospiraceae bacterium]